MERQDTPEARLKLPLQCAVCAFWLHVKVVIVTAESLPTLGLRRELDF